LDGPDDPIKSPEERAFKKVDDSLKRYCECMTRKDADIKERQNLFDEVSRAYGRWCEYSAHVEDWVLYTDGGILGGWLEVEEREVRALWDLYLEEPSNKEAARRQMERLEVKCFHIKYPNAALPYPG
jgi:hypothetical protein